MSRAVEGELTARCAGWPYRSDPCAVAPPRAPIDACDAKHPPVGEGPGAGQQELLQDDELLPHEDELLPQVDELPHDEEPPPEQSLDECSLAPASHQDGWSTGLPEACPVVALYVPVPVGHAPWPGPALEPDPVARMLRSSQARRHARRTIQVITDTSANTNTPTHTTAINMTSPLRRAAAPGLPAVCPAMH